MSTSKVKTRRVRVIAMPERITSKNGNRDYGRERKHPKTIGWRRKPA